MTNKEYLLKLWLGDTEAMADDIMDIDLEDGGYWPFTVGDDNMVKSLRYSVALAAQVAWLEAEHMEVGCRGV